MIVAVIMTFLVYSTLNLGMTVAAIGHSMLYDKHTVHDYSRAKGRWFMSGGIILIAVAMALAVYTALACMVNYNVFR